MRILLVAALLVATASCAWPPPQAAAPVPPPPGTAVAIAAPVPAPPSSAAVPAPPPAVAAVGDEPPLFGLYLFGARPPGRLTLSNFSFDSARVQAVITSYPDCRIRPGTATSDFALPLNGTRIIAAPSGSDVCWRRELLGAPPGMEEGAAPTMPAWTEWNRAFTASGRFIDSQL